MTTEELVMEIGAALVEDPALSAHPWERLAMVAQYAGSSSEIGGFVYLPGGKAISAAPRSPDISDKFDDLRKSMVEPGKPAWLACAVWIDKATEDITIDFEYKDPERWRITFDNLDEMAEKLRTLPR